MDAKIDIKAEANLTKPIEEITTSVVIPPTKEVANGVTKLLSVVTTFIDNVTYKYIANSEYKKQEFLNNLSEKYNSIPIEDVVEPNMSVLGNVMDNLKYNLDEDFIVEMYTNILISDMDRKTKDKCHICFVEILKQLSKNDLELLKAIYMIKETKSISFGKLNIVDSKNQLLKYEFHNSLYVAGIKNYNIHNYNQFSNSIENLERLGLIEINYNKYFTEKSIYDKLVNAVLPYSSDIMGKIKIENAEAQLGCERGVLSINNLGYNLMQLCLRDDNG